MLFMVCRFVYYCIIIRLFFFDGNIKRNIKYRVIEKYKSCYFMEKLLEGLNRIRI